MIKKLLSLSAIFIGINAFAQCPTSSIPNKNCTIGDKIEAFTLNSIAATGNSGCGASGYSSSVQTWSLNVGQTYNFTATTGQAAGLPQAFALFIDLNGDNQFTANEMLTSRSLAYTHTSTLTIPYSGYTIGGPKKMRIICNASLITNTMACIGGANPNGEVEDYNVILTCPTLTPTVSTPTILCSAKTETLNALNAGNTFTWIPGSSSTSSLVVATTATVAGTTSYTMITGVTGCPGTTSTIFTLAVSPSPTTTISGITTICPFASGTVNLTASGAASYTWNPGAINTATASFSPAATTIYTVDSQLGSCVSSQTFAVTLATTITPSVNSGSLCSGKTKTLTVTGGGDTYSWLPGLQSTPSISITTTATTVGTQNYTVSTGFAGCPLTFVTTMLTVNVAPSPTILVSSSSTLACKSNTLMLSASGATSYLWSIAGATTATVIITPTATAVYSVTGTLGYCPQTNTINITPQSPTITAMASPSVVCIGLPSTLSCSGGVSYVWSNGSTSTSITNTNVAATTSYTVIGSDAAGCISQAVVTVIAQSCVGLDEIESNQTSIYPNPFNSVITISVNDNLVNNSIIEVYDAIGKLVIKETINVSKKTINTTNLIEGIYIYKIQSNGNTTKVGKIIKN